jgi:hypothetical protein
VEKPYDEEKFLEVTPHLRVRSPVKSQSYLLVKAKKDHTEYKELSKKRIFFIGWRKVLDHMQVISNIELLPMELRIDHCTGVLY